MVVKQDSSVHSEWIVQLKIHFNVTESIYSLKYRNRIHAYAKENVTKELMQSEPKSHPQNQSGK